MSERLGPHAVAHVAAGELAPLVQATRAGDTLDTLLRLGLHLAESPEAVRVTGWTAGRELLLDITMQGVELNFDAFVRMCDPIDPDAPAGFGLALAGARQIVFSYSGSIDVRPEPGVGSALRLILPLA